LANSKIVLGDRYVHKIVSTDIIETAEKYRALESISTICGFIAPHLEAVNVTSHQLTFTRLQHIHCVRELYLFAMRSDAGMADAENVFYKTGEILSKIHNNLPRYSASKEWVGPREFDVALAQYGYSGSSAASADEVVPLHGDFGFANVFYKMEATHDPRIVVIDPCGDNYTTSYSWCHGSRYIDIAKMILCLEGKISLLGQFKLRRRVVCRLQKAFLRGYQSASGVLIEQDRCFAFAYAIAVCYFKKKHSFFPSAYVQVIYNAILNSNFPLSLKINSFRESQCS
jgi:hypothetical protein